MMWQCANSTGPSRSKLSSIFPPRGPLLVAHLDHVSHVALWPRVVRLVLLAHQDDEVQVVPDVVLQLDVLLEGHRLVVKLVPLQTCMVPESERGPAATPPPPAGSKGSATHRR